MKATFNLPAILDITEQDPASEVYQAVEFLEFERDAMTTGLLIDEFVLDGEFKAVDINVLANDAPIKVEVEKVDDFTMIVRLPGPYQLQRINVEKVQIGNIVMAEKFIGLGYFDYRLSDSHQSVGAALVSNNRLEEVRKFAVSDFRQGNRWSIAADEVDIYPVVGDKILTESIANIANNSKIEGLQLEAFAIRAKDFSYYSSKKLLLNDHKISIFVHSQPQGLNLSIAPVSEDDTPKLDEMVELNGFNLASNQDLVPLRNATDIWTDGLQNFLNKNFETFTDANMVKLAVVFRSENPCQFERGSSDSAYRLLFRDPSIFPDIDPNNTDAPTEQPLDFPGNQWQNSYYQLSLPANSLLHSARLPFKKHLKKNAFSFVGEPPSEQFLTTATGIELSSDQWTGDIFQLVSAQSVRYLLLPLMATQANTVCAVEIREDVNGLPSGSILTQQLLQLETVGKRVWMSIALDDALPLYSKKLWWLVKTKQGKAIQFGMKNQQGAGVYHFSLSESGGPSSVFRFTPEFSVTPSFARDGGIGNEELHAFIADENDWQALASSAEPTGNLKYFDLLPQLPDQTQAPVTAATLRLASLLKGGIKLYPPEIIYELVE